MRHLLLLGLIALAIVVLDLATRRGPAPCPAPTSFETASAREPGPPEHVSMASGALQPLSIDGPCLEGVAQLHVNAEREALEGILERLLEENDDIGDRSLAWVADSDLSDEARYGAMLILRTCLVLKSHDRLPKKPLFSRGRDAVVLNLLVGLASGSGVHDSMSTRLWRMAIAAQVVGSAETSTVIDLLDPIPGVRPDTATFLIQLLAQCLDDECPESRIPGRRGSSGGRLLALLDELRTHPDWRVRRLAYDRLAAMNVEQVDALTEQLARAEGDRDAIFLGLCRQIPVEELPFLLLRAWDEEIDVDYEHGLAAYLGRVSGSDYRSIIYLHGDGREADAYRRRAVQAINFVDSADEVADALLEQAFEVFYTDPSPDVRAAALLVLSLRWDSRDTEGFEDLASRATDPGTVGAVAFARSNFEKRRSRGAPGHPNLVRVHKQIRQRLGIRPNP